MMGPEKFCLKWNDFQRNLTSSIKFQRENQEFADVTLVCEDNQRIEAHKVILSGASNFFRSVLTGNKHPNPMIYMRGVNIKYLEALVDFIYNGETSICQEDLEDFLKIAQELELKGLRNTLDNIPEKDINEIKKEPKLNQNHDHGRFQELYENTFHEVKQNTVENQEVTLLEGELITDSNISLSFKDGNSEWDRIINGMLNKIGGIWTCTRCGKTDKRNLATRVKKHIETHIQGMEHPCGYCGKVLKSRNCLQVHISRNHSTK